MNLGFSPKGLALLPKKGIYSVQWHENYICHDSTIEMGMLIKINMQKKPGPCKIQDVKDKRVGNGEFQ